MKVKTVMEARSVEDVAREPVSEHRSSGHMYASCLACSTPEQGVAWPCEFDEPVRHWLLFDDQRQVTGCRCGFLADLDADSGWGDSVVAHLIEVGQNMCCTFARG